jgi:hypothetical protein
MFVKSKEPLSTSQREALNQVRKTIDNRRIAICILRCYSERGDYVKEPWGEIFKTIEELKTQELSFCKIRLR